MKVCKFCNRKLPNINFNKLLSAKDGLQPLCRECDNYRCKKHYEINRERIIKNKIKYNYKKSRTKEGFVSNLYWYIKNRIKTKPSYKDRKLQFSREWFVKFALNDIYFNKLYSDWISSGRIYRLTPSVDRINNSKDYSKDNIQFLTVSDNSRKNNK